MTKTEDSSDEGKRLLSPPETSADGSTEHSIDVEAEATPPDTAADAGAASAAPEEPLLLRPEARATSENTNADTTNKPSTAGESTPGRKPGRSLKNGSKANSERARPWEGLFEAVLKTADVGPPLIEFKDLREGVRKWVHAAIAEAYRHHFYGHVEAETTKYLVMILADPSRFLCYTREHCGRIMSRLAWDQRQQGVKNGCSAETTLHWGSVSGPITNTMTTLWHLPWALNPWKRFEVAHAAEQRAWWLDNYDISKRRFLAGDLPKDTWAYRYMEQVRAGGNETLLQERDEEMFASCMIGFINLIGVVTISGPLKFFLMAMALHPEWQRKAQAEIDQVCGDDMPTLANFADLPTVRAILKETVRWRSGVPLGVPHQAEKDDVYRGVPIKKGTINIADDEMFVFGAAVLWGFDMSQKIDQRTGKPVPIDTQATNSHVVLEPDPYEMSFRARSEARAAQIVRNYEQVRPTLKVVD
ncbi:hypothetical protein NEMBOFW57_009443 [Staphylotrichum longicolle]|uniref:Uncharacterized protein n=1 Tax=Staphylotrichum longicolle TaxID=669026 RepID=A0AAD4ET25_9PEZI|nr:hypothetical protein NEMBOFW57_009443 [Staphylotrichum longicolle]